jgi:WASH complex subunit strumpellin
MQAKDLKDYAQLDLRFELAKLTHQVSIFTEGVLVMEKTASPNKMTALCDVIG